MTFSTLTFSSRSLVISLFRWTQQTLPILQMLAINPSLSPRVIHGQNCQNHHLFSFCCLFHRLSFLVDLPIYAQRRNDMFVYILLPITLIYIVVVIYDINMNDRSFRRKRIHEDVPEDRNSLKPFQYWTTHFKTDNNGIIVRCGHNSDACD